MAVSLALLAERELRGQDVPGANDNASGAAVAAQLAAECAAHPLEHTEVHLLVTSCEESGLLGAQAYARAHGQDAAGTTFVNFDTVGGDVPLTYILQEGGPARYWPASPRLVQLAEAIARRRPELGLGPAPTTPGLPTDATVFRVRGWEAITLPRPIGAWDPELPPAERHVRERLARGGRPRARNRARGAERAGPSRLGVRAVRGPSTGTAARVRARIRLAAASSARFSAAEEGAERRSQAGADRAGVGANRRDLREQEHALRAAPR